MRLFASFHKVLLSLKNADFIGLFLVRLYLSYVFWQAGMGKMNNLSRFSEWLATLNIPFSEIMTWIVIITEAGGAFLLLIGLFVRWVTIPMLFIMFTAVFTVHFNNGWSQENNGIEMAATYSLFLFILLLSGPGRYLSLDYWVKSEK